MEKQTLLAHMMPYRVHPPRVLKNLQGKYL